MLDGRHTGTGGGNHFVLGGATPNDSPVPASARLATQPDCATGTPIRRCRTCSRACSSGQRARRRAWTKRVTTRCMNWSWRSNISRRWSKRRRPGSSIGSLRTLLIDVTGNTHRAEFCIDKLFSPDSASGRLGLAGDARVQNAAACPHESHAATAVALADREVLEVSRTSWPGWFAGVLSCTIVSCCRISSSRICTMCWPSCVPMVIHCSQSGSRHIWSFVFPGMATSATRGVDMETRQALGTRGTSWARRERTAEAVR